MKEGDSGFVGVDMRNSPHLLEAGYASNAVNMRFRHGKAETREGYCALRWGALSEPLSENTSAAIAANRPLKSLGECLGIGTFKDPNDTTHTIVAVKNKSMEKTNPSYWIKVYALREGTIPQEVPVSQDLYDGPIQFTQCNNALILHQGVSDPTNYPLLAMDDIVVGFRDLTDPGEGALAMPASATGVFIGNRLFIPVKNDVTGKVDTVIASDLLDYHQYSPLNEFTINQGEDDKIIALEPFDSNRILVFKRKNIYLLNNVVGDLSNVTVDRINGSYGLVAPMAVQTMGSDVWFLNETGIVSLQKTDFSSIQAITNPVSDPVEPLIKRINWQVAKNTAVTGYWNNKFYLSVPIDGAKSNNAIIIYDLSTRTWQGIDQVDHLNVSHFFIAETEGYNRLHYYSFNPTHYEVNSPTQSTYKRIGFGHAGVVEYGIYDYAPVTDRYETEIELLDDPTIPRSFTVDNNTITSSSGAVTNSFLWSVPSQKLDATAISNFQEGFRDRGSESEPLWVDNTYVSGNYTKTDTENGVKVTLIDSPISFIPEDYFPTQMRSVNSIFADLQQTKIPYSITTRGYHWAGGRHVRATTFTVNLHTFDANYSVSAIADGVNESTSLLLNKQPDRHKFFTAGRPTFNATNVNNDYAAKNREDYSLVLHTNGTDLQGGLDISKFQSQTHRLRVPFSRGAYVQFKVNGDGASKIVAIMSGAVSDKNEFSEIR